METNLIVLGASLVVIASFFFNYLSSKSNIPSVLMLMVLGYILGQFVEIPEGDLKAVLPALGTVGVILIVLEAALDIKLSREKTPILWRSLVLSIVLLMLTAGLSSLIMMPLFDMSFSIALLYSIPLAVMSSAIIIPSVQSLLEHKKEFMVFESAFSDIFGIVAFYVLAGALEGGDGMSIGFAGGQIGKLVLTLLIGVGASYGLIMAFPLLKGHVRLFLLIAALIALYTAGKLIFHLYGALFIILIFGLVIANKELFFRGPLASWLNKKKVEEIYHGLHVVTLESAFVVRTFFFVIFGITIVFSSLASFKVAAISALCLAVIYIVRWILLRVAIGKDILPQLFIAPRGLITVLLYYAIPTEAKSEGFSEGILLFIIIGTSLIMTWTMIADKRRANVALGKAKNVAVTEVKWKAPEV